MDFTEWLKSQMAHYRLTIYQISKKSGVHQTTIKNWLNGAKPQGTKADAVKIAVQDLIKENDALLSSLPWEQLAAENAILNERIKKEQRPANSEALVSSLPENIQALIKICRANPELASALLLVAQQIQNGSAVQE